MTRLLLCLEGEEERVGNKRKITEQTEKHLDITKRLPSVPLFSVCSVLSFCMLNALTQWRRAGAPNFRFQRDVRFCRYCRRSFRVARPCNPAASDKGSSW